MPFQTNLVFETDETVKVVEFQTIDDNLIEGNEASYVTLYYQTLPSYPGYDSVRATPDRKLSQGDMLSDGAIQYCL